jgi:DNA-binding FadR family transcriptional regulator
MEKIKELIASGEYKPNDRLASESELAGRFGIGRSSIREAIKVFQYLGIVKSYTAKGTFVCDRSSISTEALTWSIILGNNDLYNLLDLRMLLEEKGITCLIADYKADIPEAGKILDQMQQQVERMKTAKKESSLEDLIEADYSFHELIIQGAKNPLYIDIYHTLRSFLHSVIKEVFLNRLGVTTAPQTHQALINAIRRADREEALRLYQKHVQTSKEKIKSRIRSSPAKKSDISLA